MFIISELDEAPRCGGLIAFLLYMTAPVSYSIVSEEDGAGYMTT